MTPIAAATASLEALFTSAPNYSNLLPLLGVLGLGGLLGGAPPGLVVAVPGDGGGQALGEVGVLGRPAQLAA